MLLNKGKITRESLIQESRLQFNERGLNLTLANLASLLHTTLGRLTYHFPTKDLLFIGILSKYEEELSEIRQNSSFDNYDFESFVEIVGRIMDLQYKYRCAIRYTASVVRSQSELVNHNLNYFGNNKIRIRKTVEALIQSEDISAEILEPDNYAIFQFSFANLFTTWVLSLDLFDAQSTYEEMKPVYIKGILSTFYPYLTSKGKTFFSSFSIEG